MDQTPHQLYLEDFTIGQKFEGALRLISNADVQAFSSLTGDAHPIHYDAEYASRTRFGQPIVHGLHLLSLTAVGATPLSAQLRESMVAFLQQGATFLKPVFVNDTVRSAFEVVEVGRDPGKQWGQLKLRAVLINQHGDTVLAAFHVYRLRCRVAATSGGGL